MRRSYEIGVAMALTAAALLTAVLPLAYAENGVTDSNGRPVGDTERARILAIGGDVTEILYAVGAQDKIVAVDSTSQYPAEALKEKKDVGYMRALSTEGVLSTAPSMIVASAGAGPPEVVKALKASGVAYIDVADDHDPKGVAGKVRTVAAAAGEAEKGEALAREVEGHFTALEADRRRIAKPLKAIFLLGVQNGRATIGGTGSSGDAILKLAGLENAATSFSGYKPLVDEALIELQPDIIVVMQRADKNHDAAKALDGLTGLAQTPAGKAKRIVAMDGLYLIGFGPRAPAAARELMLSAYPELGTAAR